MLRVRGQGSRTKHREGHQGLCQYGGAVDGLQEKAPLPPTPTPSPLNNQGSSVILDTLAFFSPAPWFWQAPP